MDVTSSPTPAASPRRPLGAWWDRVLAPVLPFAIFAVLALALIWGGTFSLLAADHAAADRTAFVSSREQFETYQAEVVRALREVDETLKVVKFAYETRGERAALGELRDRNLLPPDRFFDVSVRDSSGALVASTARPGAAFAIDEPTLQALRQGDALMVSRPLRSPASRQWRLQFTRRLDTADGRFGGVVAIEVDSAYFVSGYDAATLGDHGVLGLVGVDGIVCALRSGDEVTAGQHVDFAALMAPGPSNDGNDTVSASPWDGVRRYEKARQLYDFPLAVVVGLSADEQLAASRRDARTDVWWAVAGSGLLILVVWSLASMSRRLALTRERAMEVQFEHAATIEYIACHDALTGLPNRGLFSKLLTQSIQEARRFDRLLAVLFLDLDQFQRVNDTLGHEAGDRLLQEVARRVRDCLRESDVVARLGGDEFVVLLPEIDDGADAAVVGQKILSAITRPFLLGGQEFRVTASVGISVFPRDGRDEPALVKNADAAMVQARAAGSNAVRFHSRDPDSPAR